MENILERIKEINECTDTAKQEELFNLFIDEVSDDEITVNLEAIRTIPASLMSKDRLDEDIQALDTNDR